MTSPDPTTAQPLSTPPPTRKRRTGLIAAAAIGVAVLLVAAAVVITLALAGGSARQPTVAASAAAAPTTAPTSGPPDEAVAEPRTYDGAKAMVDKIDAAAMANDGGTTWDLMTSAGQATMPRADYIKVTQGCPKLISSNTVLSLALDAGGGSATVTVSAPPAQGGQPYTYRLIYEAGRWKRQPSEAAMSWMGLGADKALTVLRSGGYC